MKILIVDDNARASERIRGILSAAQDVTFLEISEPQFAHRLVDFGICADVALIDLRFPDPSSADGQFDGLAICQKIRHAMPEAVIIGYSSSFSLATEDNRQLMGKFQAMGADIVCALDHLTLTPASELRYEFKSVRDARVSKPPGGEAFVKPRVFIGSSKEQIEVARRIQAALADDFVAEVWNETAFGLSDVTIEALERAVREFQFGVFVFTPDDQLTSQGQIKHVPRDNVVFEAGLFVGSLGRSRTFVVKQRSQAMSLPSDLAGLTTADFDAEHGNMAAALGPACQKIRDAANTVLANDPSRSKQV